MATVKIVFAKVLLFSYMATDRKNCYQSSFGLHGDRKNQKHAILKFF